MIKCCSLSYIGLHWRQSWSKNVFIVDEWRSRFSQDLMVTGGALKLDHTSVMFVDLQETKFMKPNLTLLYIS